MNAPWFLPTPLVDVAALTLWWGLLRLSRRRDNRRLRNGLLFLLLVGAMVRALLHLAALTPVLTIPVGLGSAVFFLLIVLMPFLLTFNGIVLIRREGRRLSNLLCLAAGLGLTATPMAAAALAATASLRALLVATFMFYACVYLGVFLLISPGQTTVQRTWGGRRAMPHPDVVVVHGAGLIDGRVGPLLGSRIAGGIEAWRDEEGLRPRMPLLVMSGGQGADEPVSETRAMADYAIARGVPPEWILLEDRSTATHTNISYTHDLLVERGMVDLQVLLVTSSFHAACTAVLVSDMGVPWAVAPARTAWFYIVNTWLREYVTVLTYWRRLALAYAAVARVFVVLCVLLVLGAQTGIIG